MKRLSRALCLLLIAVLMVVAVGCGAEDDFEGGRPLDGEELRRLRESLIESSENEETDETVLPDVVYWFDGGSVWHADPGCAYLKNREELCSGSPTDAFAAGVERGCSRCGK